MSGITTTPITKDQVIMVMNSFDSKGDWNMLAITSLLMKATRINDLLNTITIGDVYDNSGKLREELNYVESKTKKPKTIILKGKLLEKSLTELYPSLSKKDRTCNLFYSRKGRYSNTVMSKTNVNRKFKSFVGMFGIEALTSHAVRKTCGRLMYEAGVSITDICEIYNHSSPKISYKYICVTPNHIKKALSVLEF